MYIPAGFLISFIVIGAFMLAFKRGSMPRDSWNVYAGLVVTSGIIGAAIGNTVLWYLGPSMHEWAALIAGGIMICVGLIIAITVRIVCGE